jgi:hypothetical protein
MVAIRLLRSPACAAGVLLGALLVLQIGLGIANVVMSLPLWVAVRTTPARPPCCSCWCRCWRGCARPTHEPAVPSPGSQYWALTKPRVVALIVFTAIIGMLLAIQPGDECRRGAIA